jgi:hypothetical protein
MAEVRYSEGNILFAEGDYSDHVVRIIEGEVEVLKQVKDQLVTLGRVGEGEFVGEMGVLEGRPRSATVRATSAVVAEQMDRNTFLRLISADGATAFNLLVRLSERLAATDQAYARAVVEIGDGRAAADQAVPAGEHEAEHGAAALTLFAGSARLASLLPLAGIAITRFPFVVGRAVKRGEAAPACAIDLTVPDSVPLRMSRLHFWIARGSDGPQIRDCGSTLGTLVNGVGIGQHFIRDHAVLTTGENVVVAGGVGSPYVFRVVFE